MKPREKRANQRKIDILLAAAQVFNDKGYHEATIEEIADKIQYTKGSIYYYVKSKQDLLFQCNKLAMDMLIKKLDEIVISSDGPEEKLRKTIQMHIKTAIDEFSVMVTALQLEFALEEPYKHQIIELRDVYERKILSVLEEGIAKSIFKKEIDLKITGFIIIGAMNWMKRWYSKSGRLGAGEIADIYCNYLIPPLLKTN